MTHKYQLTSKTERPLSFYADLLESAGYDDTGFTIFLVNGGLVEVNSRRVLKGKILEDLERNGITLKPVKPSKKNGTPTVYKP